MSLIIHHITNTVDAQFHQIIGTNQLLKSHKSVKNSTPMNALLPQGIVITTIIQSPLMNFQPYIMTAEKGQQGILPSICQSPPPNDL